MSRSHLGAAVAGVLAVLALVADPASAAPALQQIGPALKVTKSFTVSKTQARAASRKRAKVTARAAADPQVRVAAGPTYAGFYPLATVPIGPQAIGDDQLLNYTVPAYTYLGQTYTSIGVSANGYVVVGGGDTVADAAVAPGIGSTKRPNAVLAPFWTDLHDDSTTETSRGLRLATLASTSEPPCVRDVFLVVEWRMYEYGTTTERGAQVWIQTDDVSCATDPVPGQRIYFTYDHGTMTASPARAWGIGAENLTGTESDSVPTLPTEHFVVTGASPNTAPVAADDSYETIEDTTLARSAPGFLANDTDAEGHTLRATVVSTPANGTLTSTGDGEFSYQPDAGFVGKDAFTYRVSDGARSSGLARVAITVKPRPNTAPSAADDTYSTNEGQALTVAAPGVIGNDSDTDGDPLAALRLDDVDHGTLTLNGDGSFTYVPDPGFGGTDTFTYRLNDGRTSSAAATATITVVPRPNVAPATVGESYGTHAGRPLTVVAPGLLANDTDADGDPLSVASVDAPAHGTLAMASSGEFVYTPDAGYAGTDRFAYRVTDGRVTSGWTSVSVDVAAPATSDPAPLTTGAASLTPQPTLAPDLTTPIVSAFKLPKRARLATMFRGIAPQFRCDEACSITVRMSVRKRGAKLPTTVLQTSASTRTSGLQTLRMRLKPTRMRNLAGRTVRIAITATDASGNRTTLHRTLTLT